MSTQKNVSNETDGGISPLGQNPSNAEIAKKINELVEKVNSIKVRDRGPKSTRTMTDEDALRVKFGDLKDKGHMAAAKELGLSYGQIYSCRCGYTFNHVKDPKKS